MTGSTDTMSPIAQQVVLFVLAVTLLLEVGCVSRHTYDRVKAETLEQTQALEAVREDIRGLEREIAGLQASNRREDAATSELRAAIQREEEQLPTASGGHSRVAENTGGNLNGSELASGTQDRGYSAGERLLANQGGSLQGGDGTGSLVDAGGIR
jgi:hypothetical protein